MSAKSVSAADFHQEVLSHEQPVLVDFWAPWCSPCRTVAPVIDDLARDYQGKVKIVKLNIDDNPQITEIHRHRDRVAAGFTQRGRGDFRQPERGGDGRNFAERRGIVLHKVCSGTARQGQDPE